MADPPTWWVGVDESGGIPCPGRPDAAAAPSWSLDDVAAAERPRHPTASPNGGRLAYVLDRDSSDVWTLPLDGPGPPARITTTRGLVAYWDDEGAEWSPDGTMLAFNRAGSVCVVPASGGVARTVIAGSSPVWLDERRLVVGIDRRDRTGLAIVDIDDPWPVPVLMADGDCFGAVVSPDRTCLAALVAERGDLSCTSLHVVEIVSGTQRCVARDASMAIRSPVWAADGASILYAGEAPGWYEVFVVAADGGVPRQITSASADFGEMALLPGGQVVVATRARAGVTDLVTIDLSSGEVATLAGGGTWTSPRPLPDGSVVAAHESFSCPPRLCRIGPTGLVTVLVSGAPATIQVAPHVVPEHVSYRSLDGLDVHGWLYRPHTASAERPCPAVVNPHGGPTSVTGDEWDGVAQYFVDLGYAWFSINPRGSTTYGREFERANHGVWGVADTLDCLAAHAHLVSLGWVDASRVAVFGASYGSYLALHSVVDDPEHRFACAISKYGDCDILTSWAQGDLVGRLDLERMMGHPRDHPVEYQAGSPIHRIHQVTVPILVAHGELDDRVHLRQAEELVAALRTLDKQFEYVTYPTEGHGLLRREPFLHFHRRLQRFLDWYLMR